MPSRHETTDHEETTNKSNAPKWIALAGTAAALGAGGYLAYRMTRHRTVKDRVKGRVDTFVAKIKR